MKIRVSGPAFDRINKAIDKLASKNTTQTLEATVDAVCEAFQQMPGDEFEDFISIIRDLDDGFEIQIE